MKLVALAKKESRAQSSTEFIIVVAGLVFIAGIMQLFISGKASEAWHVRAALDSQDVCTGVASELSLAGYSEGRSAYFTVPSEIAGSNYTLTVWEKAVTVDFAGHSCVKRFNVASVKYNGASPPFNLTGGVYRANTTGGLVTLEKVS